MTTPVQDALVDNSTRDGTGDAIEGAEVDANPNTLASILDGSTETVLNMDTGSTDGMRIRVPEVVDISAAAGGVRTALRVRHDPATGTATDNDGVEILFQGDNDAATPEKIIYGEIECLFTDVSDGTEDAQFNFKLMSAGTSTTALALSHDAMSVAVGGVTFIDITEDGTQDKIVLGNQGDVDLVVDCGGANSLVVEGATGTVLLGSATPQATNTTPKFQMLGDAGADAYMLLGRWTADVTPPEYQFVKSRNAAIGSNTIVVDGDRLGAITFRGDDGVDFRTPGAQIHVEVDGTPAADSMPGRIIFSTTADTENSVTEALRIDSGQRLIVGVAEAVQTSTLPKLQVLGNAGADAYMLLGRWTADTASPEFQFVKSRETTIGSFTKVESGDNLGTVSFRADDGTDYATPGAQISAEVDAATAANQIPGRIVFKTNPGGATVLERMRVDDGGNVVVGTAAIATTATDGFLYIPTCAGAPTGVPTAYTGRVALVMDSVTGNLYAYNGAWIKVTLS